MLALRAAMLSPCLAAMGMKRAGFHAHGLEKGAEFRLDLVKALPANNFAGPSC